MASELYDILRNADECTRIRIWRALYADYREGAKTADPNTYMMRDVTDDEWDEVLQKKAKQRRRRMDRDERRGISGLRP